VNHPRERLSASDATKLLNVTPEAVRQRIRRGTIEYERTEDGRYFVYVMPSEDVSALRASFEAALEGRRGELAAHDEIPRAIGMINAQLEGIESLLGNLRGELLALDASPTSLSPESRLVGLKQRVAYFRRSLDEVKRSVDSMPQESSDRLTKPLPERLPTQ